VKNTVVIPKTWRSESTLICVFVVLAVTSIYLSYELPGSILSGKLVAFGTFSIDLHLPLFWLFPLFTLLLAIFRIYNVRYLVDDKGIETRVGVLWTQQHIVRVRYEDVLSIETHQTLLERFLSIGVVEVATAATGGVEIVMEGIGAPFEIQEMIQAERDARQKAHHTSPSGGAKERAHG
jgi:uncharacterized membrane protein YdbT with pleckstrin-like domain